MKKPVRLAGAAPASLILSAAAALAGGAVASAAPLARPVSSIPSQDTGAAGYQAMPKTGGATAFRYAQASFTVPTAVSTTCNEMGGNTSLVAGLGSYVFGKTAEQAGVFINCTNGSGPTYQGGYLPGTDPHFGHPPDGAFTVSPGDTIFASVYYSAAAQQFTYTVQDQTSGRQVRVTAACAATVKCTTSSAEVIAGTPLEQYQPFSRVQFSGVQVTDSAGQKGGLSNAAWRLIQAQDDQVDQDPPTGITQPQTSGGLSSFSVYYPG